MAVPALLLLGLWLAGCGAAGPDGGPGHARAGEPPPVPYCTRSLGSVDCWRQPPLALPLPRGVADGRAPPLPPQPRALPWRW